MKKKKLMTRTLTFLLSLAMVFTLMVGVAFAGETDTDQGADAVAVEEAAAVMEGNGAEVEEIALEEEAVSPEIALQDDVEDPVVFTLVDKAGVTTEVKASDIANATAEEGVKKYGSEEQGWTEVEATFYSLKSILSNAEFDTSAIHGLAAIASDKFTTGFASDQLDDVYLFDNSTALYDGEPATGTGWRTALDGSAGNKWASDVVTIRVVAEGDHAMFFKKGKCRHFCAICDADEPLAQDADGNCLHKYAYCGEEFAKVFDFVDKEGNTVEIHECELANATAEEGVKKYGSEEQGWTEVTAKFYSLKSILANAEFDTSAIHGLAAIASDKFTTGFASDQLDDVYLFDNSTALYDGEPATGTGWRTALDGSAGNKWASDVVTIRVVAEGDHAMFFKKGNCKHYCAICGEDEGLAETPIWAWSDDHLSAEAAFHYVHCGETKDIVPATVTSEEKGTDTVYTAKVIYNETEYTDAQVVPSKDISKAKVTLANDSMVYTGQALKPAVKSVVLGEKTLVNGTDYSVAYAGNINVGTATVTVTAKGDYTGTVKAAFKITKAKQPMKVTKKNQTAKYGRKTTVKAITVTKNQGKVTYKKVKLNKKKLTKFFTVSKKTGKITVKKGVPKGSYKLTVTVSAAGDSNYAAGSKKAVVTIKVQ